MVNIWEYILVFIMAATPWIEVLVVIPVAIASGLSPFWVVMAAFVGNVIPVWIIIAIYEKWEIWQSQRKSRKSEGEKGSYDSQVEEQPKKISKRGNRARKIWNRYGLPGLALLAPAITGIHLAAVMALAFKSPKRSTAIWMTISLAVWSIGMGIISFYGLSLFKGQA
ncbi:MAG: small multi-drug export protein [Clostridia bacterium]|nr:small multi-drug export protein [Clostridia bacterium]